jgi:hypothetical protein
MSISPDTRDLDACAQLWTFNAIERPLAKPDIILVMGSNDLNVGVHAARLAAANDRSIVICSGGISHQSDLLKTDWQRPEADVFADLIENHGIDRKRIRREIAATNTAENVINSRALTEREMIAAEQVLVVQKPFMCLRALLTAERHWPGAELGVSHEDIPFEAYFERYGDNGLVDIIVGDTQRIVTYPQRGYFREVPVPADVSAALTYLIERGFTAHMPPP